jgi:hypothetical protein
MADKMRALPNNFMLIDIGDTPNEYKFKFKSENQ